LLETKLSLKFWKETMVTTVYIKNRTLVNSEGKTPEKIYNNKILYIGHLRTWGCLIYTKMPKKTRNIKFYLTGI
jgi:hypothetical protein